MARPHTSARCPECTADTGSASVRHCESRTCGWRRCRCGTVISDYGMWTRPPQPPRPSAVDVD